jgi:nitrite reductase/ring-hydroxylating ferredoxin subunit
MTARTHAKTNVIKRLFCISVTSPVSDPGSLTFAADSITIDLGRAPELAAEGGAMRLESESLPDRIIVVHGIDDQYYAYGNHCACGGFRIDPVPGERKIRCCTLAQSTFDYEGNRLSGSAKDPLTTYPVTCEGPTVRIDLAGKREGGGAAKTKPRSTPR